MLLPHKHATKSEQAAEQPTVHRYRKAIRKTRTKLFIRELASPRREELASNASIRVGRRAGNRSSLYHNSRPWAKGRLAAIRANPCLTLGNLVGPALPAVDRQVVHSG